MSQREEYPSPTRISSALFQGKAVLLRLRRSIQDRTHNLPRHPKSTIGNFPHLAAASVTPLWTDTNPAEAWYQRGKTQNLRVAAGRLHLVAIPAGTVFSFWKQVGRASVGRGYVRGRMLQEGCMIPSVGGGLCQLSNAIYQVAVEAGCEILERYPHSRVVPGSATAQGRDATVAWNYIDLRFRPHVPMQLRVMLTGTDLCVSLHTTDTAAPSYHLSQEPNLDTTVQSIFGNHACESCGNTSCFRHDPTPVKLRSRSTTAFLLDSAWPEFQEYVATHHGSEDILAIPLDGERWNRPQYNWQKDGFARQHTATLATLIRAVRSRGLAAQGAARQRGLLESAATLAKQLGKCLDPDVDGVCISQSLLPFLWRTGALGGRHIRVLMTQPPIADLQAKLDLAFEAHPESKTLRDFRAEPWLLEAEEEALSCADVVVTPHAYIASLFPAKAALLDWSMPSRTVESQPYSRSRHCNVLFPSATLGRKGVYELREALEGLNVRLLLGGKTLEDTGFWNGFDTAPASQSDLFSADIVVQPSIVESQPRTLLAALSAGIPVIATRETGLHPNSAAHFVPAMDTTSLRTAILSFVPHL